MIYNIIGLVESRLYKISRNFVRTKTFAPITPTHLPPPLPKKNKTSLSPSKPCFICPANFSLSLISK